METAPLVTLLETLAARLRETSPFGPAVDPLPVYLVLALLLAAGLVVAHLLRGARLRRANRDLAEAEALRRQVAVLEARAERLPQLEQQLAEAREERDGLLGALNQAEARLETVEAAQAARLEELRGLNEALQAKFRTLATEVLEGNSRAFLDRVTERFATHSETAKAELEARQKAIDGMVKPLNEKLGAFDAVLRDMEKHRTDAYGAIREQVEQLRLGQAQLSGETRKLVQALRAPKTRGRWGEMQLRQVFELSGMAEHVDFETETSHRTEDGLQRPDAIVRMPGGRSLVIDAKTSLDGYLDALEAETPEARDVAIRRHAKQVADHVRMLSSKRYHDLLADTPDFVVMFIPGDVFLSAAVESDPALLERAMEARVVIATPSTLIALLRTIAFGWQQEAVAENAVAIHREAKELYGRLAVFAGNLQRVGVALNRSVDSYNKAMGSLEARVLPSARKLEAMQVVQSAAAELQDAPRVETVPRRLTAPELLTSDEGEE
ncbi:DNA recombination protein RmuC [Roseicyclus persicicus]|uniref:DNA recombination protein RmuC homolog n=1 Tax=Roseicyclus persicicus TaxID=2650661 RepID=A0A7X6K080_9RHOB|nr:DNA recombination protein RmuC [Roseibacterium persicicum]NKX45553.1 DNA recombination protein RmuC [Roseibacterium persicicum]